MEGTVTIPVDEFEYLRRCQYLIDTNESGIITITRGGFMSDRTTIQFNLDKKGVIKSLTEINTSLQSKIDELKTTISKLNVGTDELPKLRKWYHFFR